MNTPFISKKILFPLGVLVFSAPISTFAAFNICFFNCGPNTSSPSSGGGLSDIIQIIYAIISALVPLLIGAGVLLFLWGVLRYVAAGDNPDRRAEGRSLMIYGIVGLFVMVSVWGLVNILVNTFNLDNSVATIPSLPVVP